MTRFSVLSPPLDTPENALRSPAPPDLGKRRRFSKRVVERLVVVSFALCLTLAASAVFFSLRIDREMSIFEKKWDEHLTRWAEEYRRTGQAKVPAEVEDVWKQVDARPVLRDFLLFEILDDVLTARDLQWSMEKALTRITSAPAITRRLPSVKQLHVVVNAEAPQIDLAGLTKAHIVMLARETSAPTSLADYDHFKKMLSHRMGTASTCASSRTGAGAGSVVLALSIGLDGRVTSVFVNKERSAKEKELWDCVKMKIEGLELPRPPGGELTIYYTFTFAGAAKVTF